MPTWSNFRYFLLSKEIKTLFLGYSVYLSLRLVLGHFFNLSIPTDDANISIITQHSLLGVIITIINSHKLFLVLMGISLYYLQRIKAWFYLFSCLSFICGYHLISHMVFDSYRSIGYGFFIYLVVINLTNRQLDHKTMQKLMYVSTFVTIIMFPLRHFLS